MRLPFQRSERTERAPDAARRALVDAGDDAFAAARTQARRRLIGAFVLLAAGVVGFPMLFETQPRPLPAHTPIITAQGEPIGAAQATPSPPSPSPHASRAAIARAPSAMAEAPAASPPVTAADAVAPAATTGSAASVPTSMPAVVPASAAAPAVPPAVTPAVKPAAKPAAVASSPSTPLPTTHPAAPRAAEPAPAEGRFVVQVGAYADAATLRETRQKVEKLGLKTYTQVIENDTGKRTRVRVGPYATRAEAQAAAVKLKAAGLPANLLAL